MSRLQAIWESNVYVTYCFIVVTTFSNFQEGFSLTLLNCTEFVHVNSHKQSSKYDSTDGARMLKTIEEWGCRSDNVPLISLHPLKFARKQVVPKDNFLYQFYSQVGYSCHDTCLIATWIYKLLHTDYVRQVEASWLE